MSSLLNKAKEAISGSNSTNQKEPTGTPEGGHGPHGRVGNTVDPRVDSDRDGREAPGHSGVPTTGHTTGHTGAAGVPTPGHTAGHTTAHPSGHTTAHTAGTEGPHGSNMMNKADPRIDSDRSGTHMGNTHGDFGGSGREGAAGPHNSRAANAADPRVDSDRDASRTVGNAYGSSGTAGTHGTPGHHSGATHGGAMGTSTLPGSTGSHGTTGTSGVPGSHSHGTTGSSGIPGSTGSHGTHAHDTTTAGSHVPGSNTHGAVGSGPGPAPKTAGPHKSDMMNKMDPRVDSNMDGSKTVGGNKTYAA
ncbi:hypothetical protein GGR56DRAFT_697423 [Xylariaceae sp. FL0804]|nr:hypothetical protein GGR56DRAFT_697423 [Xylariaceae sp. FL0804]